MSEKEPLRLLAVFAHPDDESFGPGGTLAKYAAEGVDVHICIVTDGAAGSYDPEYLDGYENIAQRRAEELQAAVRALGAMLHQLHYRDSGMEGSPDNEHPESLYQAPLEQITCDCVRLIRQVRPHVVVTHDPNGGYFHPDHIKVNQALSRAWELVNDPDVYSELGLAPWQPARLYWTALPRTWTRWFVRILRLMGRDPARFGRNKDIDLTELGTPEEEIHCRVDTREYFDIKAEASRHHASQGGAGVQGRYFPRFLARRLFGEETFTQAWPEPATPSTDLFYRIR